MSKYVIDGSTLTSIGNAIREKTGGTESIPVTDLATSISAIESGGLKGLCSIKLFKPDNTKYLVLTEEMLNASQIIIGGGTNYGFHTINMKSLDENNIFQEWQSITYSTAYGQWQDITNKDEWVYRIDDKGYLRYTAIDDNYDSTIFKSATTVNSAWIVIIP